MRHITAPILVFNNDPIKANVSIVLPIIQIFVISLCQFVLLEPIFTFANDLFSKG